MVFVFQVLSESLIFAIRIVRIGERKNRLTMNSTSLLK